MIIFGACLLLVAGAVLLAAHKPLTAEEALLLANVGAIAQMEGGSGGGTVMAWTTRTYNETVTEGEYQPCPNGGGVMWISYDVTYNVTDCIGYGFTPCTSGRSLCSKEFAWANGC